MREVAYDGSVRARISGGPHHGQEPKIRPGRAPLFIELPLPADDPAWRGGFWGSNGRQVVRYWVAYESADGFYIYGIEPLRSRSRARELTGYDACGTPATMDDCRWYPRKREEAK